MAHWGRTDDELGILKTDLPRRFGQRLKPERIKPRPAAPLKQLHQLFDPIQAGRGSVHGKRSFSPLQPEAHEKAGQPGRMIRMEVGDHHIPDELRVDPEPPEAIEGRYAAIEQDSMLRPEDRQLSVPRLLGGHREP
jgi:hypothetical protein